MNSEDKRLSLSKEIQTNEDLLSFYFDCIIALNGRLLLNKEEVIRREKYKIDYYTCLFKLSILRCYFNGVNQ